MQRMRDLTAQHLDPGSHMSEALFGLIMTLTFTLGADLVIQAQGREGARQMLIGILGCNLAWGIIDGVLYVLRCAFERGRVQRIGYEVRKAPNADQARQLVAGELDELLAPLTDPQQRDALYSAIVQRVKMEPTLPKPVTRKDLLGGLASGLLVFSCSIPAVLPFLVFDAAACCTASLEYDPVGAAVLPGLPPCAAYAREAVDRRVRSSARRSVPGRPRDPAGRLTRTMPDEP